MGHELESQSLGTTPGPVPFSLWTLPSLEAEHLGSEACLGLMPRVSGSSIHFSTNICSAQTVPGIVWAPEGEQSETDMVPALLEPLV